MPVTLQSVREAAAAIAGAVAETAFAPSRTLSEVTGAQVWLKFENHQFTASFKERGALNKLLSLDAAQRAAGVIAVSAGNHAQGVAYHAKRLGIPAVIVMPRFTPHVKVEQTRAFGAEVILHGANFDEAKAHAMQVTAARKLTLVHPYDDEKVVAGQGTIALEMLQKQPDLEMLVVPVGGGGMLAGMAVAARALHPAVHLVGVQTRRFPSMAAALEGSRPEFGASTIADGIAVKEPGRLTQEIIRREAEGILLVDEGDIEQAMLLLLEIEKTVVEGAGAVGLAALLRHRETFAGRKAGIVLSGGNIDPLTLADIVERGMVRAGRLTRLQVQLRDLPGSLAKVTAALAEANANIEEVHHERAFSHLPVQSAVVDFVLQTRGHEHVKQIVEALAAAGFEAKLHND
ncbi:MAG TPA: threonine ammonia-lyase [Burkholderiales bacterium]|nr:threonine ammonia-lyase [Burkholderiales bacterium]